MSSIPAVSLASICDPLHCSKGRKATCKWLSSEYYIYADDTQMTPSLIGIIMENAVSRLEVFVSEIRTWMKLNVLKAE